MDDENIIRLHPKDSEALQAAINDPPQPNAALRELLQPAPAVGQIEVGDKPLGFDDLAAALNMRDWLEGALEAKGAKRVGGGFGFGVADLDIELEGFRYYVTIKPI